MKEKLQKVKENFCHRFRSGSLFVKYFSVFFVMVFICFLLLGMTLSLFVSNYWTKQTEDLLKENVKTVSENCSTVLSSWLQNEPEGSVIFMANTLSTISKAIDADVFICGTDGKVILCKELIDGGLEMREDGACSVHNQYAVPQELLEEAKEGVICKRGKLDGVFTTVHLYAVQPVTVHGRVVAYVFAAEPLNLRFKDYIYNVMKMFFLASLLALAIGFVVIYVFTYNLIRPLNEMSRATKAYAKGDFSPRVHVRGEDELAELMTAFNQMATALSVQEASRRSFVANVSHELKTPMTTIGGFIDGILDGTITPEQQNHYLEIVSDETKRLARLVTAMLNMAKIEAGELQLQLHTFDLTQEIFSTMLNFEQLIEKKHIEIQGLDALQPTMIRADRDLLHQVLYNLTDNAVKFTQDGTISVSVSQTDTQTTARIRNTGTGISSEELSRIFERFYKVDKSRSYDVKGAGLGLYICKTIIEMHGGTIWVSSEEDAFTEFAFTIPNDVEKGKHGKD